MTTPLAARLLDRLVEELTAEGDLTPEWRETFLAVPRHLFIPDTVWQHDPAIVAQMLAASGAQPGSGCLLLGSSQTGPGGRILTPWANAYCDGGLLALERLGDGRAIGETTSTPTPR